MYRWQVKKVDSIGPICMESMACRMDILEMKFFYDLGESSFALDMNGLDFKDYLWKVEFGNIDGKKRS